MSARTWLVTAGALVLAAATVMALPPADEAPRLVEQVVEAGAPGVLVQMRDRGKTRTIVLGVAQDTPRRLVHASDRFRIGSVTKTFVATVVLQLVAEDRIELEDTVEEWLPGLVPGGEEITVRQLLAHMSGLFDYVEDGRVFAPYEQDPRHRWSPRALVELAVSHPSPFSPDERYAYSSTNYLLLELIVERASGTSLERQLETRIVEPLGLEGTSFEPGVVAGAPSTGTVRRRTRASSRGHRATRLAKRPRGPGARPRSCRPRTTYAGSLQRCSEARCWRRPSSGT